MREFMIGMLAVGLVAGVVLGRTTERARRSYKDYGVGKTAMEKYRKVAFGEVRRAAVTSVVVGGLLIAIFIGAMNLPG